MSYGTPYIQLFKFDIYEIFLSAIVGYVHHKICPIKFKSHRYNMMIHLKVPCNPKSTAILNI